MAVRFFPIAVIVALAPTFLLGAQLPLRPAGDPNKGKVVFERCAACHAFDEAKTDGPSLSGVFGRKAGSRDDYRYSAAMTRSDIVWDAATLDAYITNPQDYINGNRMSFAGIGDKSDRDDLIAYLEQATKPSAAR
jgi:cytochrome c